jgi:hypothetical protein
MLSVLIFHTKHKDMVMLIGTEAIVVKCGSDLS